MVSTHLPEVAGHGRSTHADGGLLRHLRVAIVGNFNPPGSGVVYQAEVLAACFAREHARVTPITYQQNRWLRPFATVWELWRRRKEYDVICVQAYSFANWINAALTVLVGRALGRPVVMVYRGGAFRQFVNRWRWIVLPLLRRADRIVVPSGFLRTEFEREGLTTTVVPNIIELDGWPRRRRMPLRPALLWVRHFREGYNPWMAVEVLAHVQRRFPDATLRMAGDGDLLDEFNRRLAAENIQGVTLLGHLSLHALQAHYDECDIFISTTNYDNQPRSVMEAMACGLPVVSTNVGGVPWLITNRVNGLLVPPGDASAMADAVCELLGDPGLSDQIVGEASARLEEHSWVRTRWRWAAIFADLGLCTID